MKISKIRIVKTPERGTDGSAGIDFFIPDEAFPYGKMLLKTGCNVNIPSGIKANIPKGHALVAFNKSGVALKKNLQVGACVIDEDYQGEIHLHLFNFGTEDRILKNGDKIVQFVLLPVAYEDVEIVTNQLDLFEGESDRGEGGFGSTGDV